MPTQSSLTQETETGFLSNNTFPVSAVEAEIETEHFLYIDTTDASYSKDEYQDFQEFVQAHKEDNNTILPSNSEHKEELYLTISDHESSTSSNTPIPGFTDTGWPTWTGLNEGSVSNNSDPSKDHPVSAVVAETDEQFFQIDSIVAGAFQQN